MAFDVADLRAVDTIGYFYTCARKGARSFVQCKLDRSFVYDCCLDF